MFDMLYFLAASEFHEKNCFFISNKLLWKKLETLKSIDVIVNQIKKI